MVFDFRNRHFGQGYFRNRLEFDKVALGRASKLA